MHTPTYPAPLDQFNLERIADLYAAARQQRTERSLDAARPGVVARTRVALGRGLMSLGHTVAGHQA